MAANSPLHPRHPSRGTWPAPPRPAGIIGTASGTMQALRIRSAAIRSSRREATVRCYLVIECGTQAVPHRSRHGVDHVVELVLLLRQLHDRHSTFQLQISMNFGATKEGNIDAYPSELTFFRVKSAKPSQLEASKVRSNASCCSVSLILPSSLRMSGCNANHALVAPHPVTAQDSRSSLTRALHVLPSWHAACQRRNGNCCSKLTSCRVCLLNGLSGFADQPPRPCRKGSPRPSFSVAYVTNFGQNAFQRFADGIRMTGDRAQPFYLGCDMAPRSRSICCRFRV